MWLSISGNPGTKGYALNFAKVSFSGKEVTLSVRAKLGPPVMPTAKPPTPPGPDSALVEKVYEPVEPVSRYSEQQPPLNQKPPIPFPIRWTIAV